MGKMITVSEAARELERSERWLRNAEAKGKIPKARRDLNGWRVYSEDDLNRLREVLVPSKQGENATLLMFDFKVQRVHAQVSVSASTKLLALAGAVAMISSIVSLILRALLDG